MRHSARIVSDTEVHRGLDPLRPMVDGCRKVEVDRIEIINLLLRRAGENRLSSALVARRRDVPYSLNAVGRHHTQINCVLLITTFPYSQSDLGWSPITLCAARFLVEVTEARQLWIAHHVCRREHILTSARVQSTTRQRIGRAHV